MRKGLTMCGGTVNKYSGQSERATAREKAPDRSVEDLVNRVTPMKVAKIGSWDRRQAVGYVTKRISIQADHGKIEKHVPEVGKKQR